LLDSLVNLNNRALRNVCKIHVNVQIPIKDMLIYTYILEKNNIYKYKLETNMYSIRYAFRCCQDKSQMNMDTHKTIIIFIHNNEKKVVIIPLHKRIKQQRHSVYRDSNL